MIIREKLLKDNNLLSNADVLCDNKRNIIIGPNGGGKTRFLRTVMDYYENEEHYADYEIVFADFPHLTYDSQSTDEINYNENMLPAHLFFFSRVQISLKRYMFLINKEQNVFIETLFNNVPLQSQKFIWARVTTALNLFLVDMLNFKFDGEKKIMTVKGEDKDYEGFKEYIFNQASPGERNLFYMSIFLAALTTHRPNGRLVIILDEPELHMHASKVTAFIDLIEQELPNAALWVATHSIHLIPRFTFDEMIFIEDGKVIQRNSGIYRRIFDSIIGSSSAIEEFMRDLTEWEMCCFISECFTQPPKTVNSKNDQQTQKICKVVQELFNVVKEGEALKILDFGAGKGRIGSALDELDSGRIEYYTYDLTDKEYNKHIKNKIKHHKEHYVNLNDIKIEFNAVLLVNVLHEIPPTNWVSVFAEINKILVGRGVLILCEALTLTSGEYLGKDEKTGKEYGYIVLDENAVFSMFDQLGCTVATTDKTMIAVINSFAFSKFGSSDNTITEARVREALKALRESSFRNYVSLLKKSQGLNTDGNVKFANGRKMAFYITQYANTRLGLELF